MQQRYKRSVIKDEAYRLRQSLKRKLKDKITFHDVSELSWKQRLIHDSTAIECFYTAAQKTANAFSNVLSGIPYSSETKLTGHLVGELLKESEFGLGFSPIVAKNENACILHYTNNSSPIQKNDLILMDFGLRWQSICSDVSRTIPAIGKFTDLQKYLMDIVLETQLKTIDMVRPGVSFNELNEFAWSTLDHLLETNSIHVAEHTSEIINSSPTILVTF